MSKIPFIIAAEEFRYWRRSRLAISVLIIAIVLAFAAAINASNKQHHALQDRQQLQSKSEQTFVDQPDRHPHRMVHYGHYVFRTPSPLSAIDPGVDSYTGTAMFLEGHRQNSATFSDIQQGSGLTQFGLFTPAFVMQVLLPLLLILMGYSVIARERESGTRDYMQAQGLSNWNLLLGKGLALMLVGLLTMLPLIVGSLLALAQGESGRIVGSFILSYFLYIAVWCMLVLLVSSFSASRSVSFSLLVCSWIALCLLLPRLASSSAIALAPTPGKLETDFAVLQKLRTLGDGHNANDPAFAALKQKLFEQYQVDKVEDLPLNFRGVVAQFSEQKLTDVLNEFAEQRMQQELSQSYYARLFGWLSPLVAVRTLSMQLAGTDLETHHRFLREAESVRISFVQALNKAQAERMTYADDMGRYNSEEALQKARISSDNWDILQDFEFAPETVGQRLESSALAGLQLLVWLVALLVIIAIGGRKV